MGQGEHPLARDWLMEIHSVLDTIELDAEAVARAILSRADAPHSDAMRAEWSLFVGHLTELAVAISDMLERAADRRSPSGCAPVSLEG
jgi:hypothetical protein